MLGPRTDVSRPITDRVKESLFSVLYKYDLPDGKVVADLFSGVGSLGLEALSRGAEFVTFVEKDQEIMAILKKNIDKAGFLHKSRVIKADAFKVGAPVNERKYDLVFVDPPYAATRQTGEDSQLSKLLVLLVEQSSQDAIVTVRTEKSTELLKQYSRFEIMEHRQWGNMAVDIFHRSSR